jgi:hypothetical protein
MTREQEMAAIVQKIRARQELTDDEKVKAKQGLATHARKNASADPRTSAKKGGGINRAELWRKAMASQDAASLEEIDNTDRKPAGTQTNMVRSVGSHADMWRRAHERARAMPPIRSDE